MQLGTVVAGHVPQQISGAVPAARTNELGTVLGLALSACHGAPIGGADGYGVFRM